jgi:hypothetical protein
MMQDETHLPYRAFCFNTNQSAVSFRDIVSHWNGCPNGQEVCGAGQVVDRNLRKHVLTEEHPFTREVSPRLSLDPVEFTI